MKFIMYHGLPGSGKDTLAAQEYPNAVRVNRDDIRTEVAGPDYHNGNQSKAVENKVTEIASQRIRDALSKGLDVVCTDTNLNLTIFKKNMEMVYEFDGVEVVHRMVDVPISVAKQQNRERGRKGGRNVPNFVIDAMAKRGYDSYGRIRTFHSRVGKNRNGDREVFVWMSRDAGSESEIALRDFNRGLPEAASKQAIVFDMDGTLADVSELVTKHLQPVRGKKNFHAFHTESEWSPPHDWVVDAAKKAYEDGYAVLVVTARNANYVGPTSRWLIANGVPANALFMRAEEDMRADYEVKRDIVSDIEALGYTITHAYDDNPQVLRLWEELGVPTTVVENEQWKD